MELIRRPDRTTVIGIASTLVIGLLFAAVAIPNLLRSRNAATFSSTALGPGHSSVSSYSSPSAGPEPDVQGGIIGGVPGGIESGKTGGVRGVGANINGIVSSQPVAYDRNSRASDKKIIRTVALELVVRNVRDIADQLRHAAQSSGGELESVSLQEQEGGTQNGQLRLRVPAERLDAALAALKKLAIRVQNEQIETHDVTRQYLDSESRLRNMHAEEQQYLALLKRAGSMKDTLQVTEKISEVRGDIERLQGELNYMSHQVAMSAIDIRLIQESDAQVAGLHWRPLYNAKLAARDMLSGLADWLDFLIALILKLPLILVWLVTAVLLASIAWKAVRWLWKRTVSPKSIGGEPSGASV